MDTVYFSRPISLSLSLSHFHLRSISFDVLWPGRTHLFHFHMKKLLVEFDAKKIEFHMNNVLCYVIAALTKNQTNERTNNENFGNGTDYQMCVCAEGF